VTAGRAIRVRAPATSANIGPGFDCAAVALDLWNELEVSQHGDAHDPDHLGVRAYSLLAPPEGLSFRFTDRIPRERGLGSSAATIALGLVAAALARDEHPDLEELLALGSELEGHADNLAAALAGGVCLTWEGRLARIADGVPAVPIAVVPSHRVRTRESRAALPACVPHADAAFTAARAALLGAAVATGSGELFAEALADRLHEPYRSPLLEELRAELPEGALGATLSGSGPTVIVWAQPGEAAACEDRVRARFTEETVLRLSVTARGAGPV
jgi:homoserine kinase